MLTQEILSTANKGIATVKIKNKDYVMVNERIKRFREVMPAGRIETEVVNLADGVVTMKASVYDDDGNLVSTGHAQEKETSSFINQTSYIENCETSCIGRALGIAGIGIDDSLGSADEVANAMQNQKELATDRERKVFIQRCEVLGQDPEAILKRAGWKSGRMTAEQHGKALIILNEIEEASHGA